MEISNLTVPEDVYGNFIPVEDLVEDVTPESARNFLQSDMVRLRYLTSWVLTACNLWSEITRQKNRQETKNDETGAGEIWHGYSKKFSFLEVLIWLSEWFLIFRCNVWSKWHLKTCANRMKRYVQFNLWSALGNSLVKDCSRKSNCSYCAIRQFGSVNVQVWPSNCFLNLYLVDRLGNITQRDWHRTDWIYKLFGLISYEYYCYLKEYVIFPLLDRCTQCKGNQEASSW